MVNSHLSSRRMTSGPPVARFASCCCTRQLRGLPCFAHRQELVLLAPFPCPCPSLPGDRQGFAGVGAGCWCGAGEGGWCRSRRHHQLASLISYCAAGCWSLLDRKIEQFDKRRCHLLLRGSVCRKVDAEMPLDLLEVDYFRRNAHIGFLSLLLRLRRFRLGRCLLLLLLIGIGIDVRLDMIGQLLDGLVELQLYRILLLFYLSMCVLIALYMWPLYCSSRPSMVFPCRSISSSLAAL